MAIKKRIARIVCLFEDVYEEPHYRQGKLRLAKIQIIYKHQADDIIRGNPKKADQFFLLQSGFGFRANASWTDLQFQWDRRFYIESEIPDDNNLPLY